MRNAEVNQSGNLEITKNKISIIGPSEKRGMNAKGKERFQPFLSICDNKKAWKGPGKKAEYNPRIIPWPRKLNIYAPKNMRLFIIDDDAQMMGELVQKMFNYVC